MSNYTEYTFESKDQHLKEVDVLDQYKKAKALNPDAIVILEDLSCGHWNVNIYKTPEQKEEFYKKRISRLFGEWRRKLI